jgi:hypothetical protein
MKSSTFDDCELISFYSVEQAVEDGGLVDAGVTLGDMCPGVAGEPESEDGVVRALCEITSMDQYLAAYGKILGKKAVTSLAPLHVPGRDELPDMEDLLREPFPCQQHVIAAGVEMLNENGSGFICGEMGTGKTLLAMSAVAKHAQPARAKGGSAHKFRCLILCADHLIAKWKREIEETIPDAKARRIATDSPRRFQRDAPQEPRAATL